MFLVQPLAAGQASFDALETRLADLEWEVRGVVGRENLNDRERQTEGTHLV